VRGEGRNSRDQREKMGTGEIEVFDQLRPLKEWEKQGGDRDFRSGETARGKGQGKERRRGR